MPRVRWKHPGRSCWKTPFWRGGRHHRGRGVHRQAREDVRRTRRWRRRARSAAELKRIQQSVHEAFGFPDTPEQRATKSAKAMIAGGDLGAQRAQEAPG